MWTRQSQTVTALDGKSPMGYNCAMARELLFQTECGASGDMLLGALIDLLAVGDEFKRTFENIGLDVKVDAADVEKNHLRCKQVTVTAPPADHGTTWAEIGKFIAATPLSAGVQANAVRVFEAIFKAEAAVHGAALKDVHLHEVGAADSLVDILGFCYLWEKLDCCPIYFTTLVTGHGSVSTRHGVLPVPPPAVLHLVQGLVCRSGDIEGELLTPTGAAILTSFGTQAVCGRTARLLKSGCGGGHRDFASMANLLRVMLLENEAAAGADGVWVLEASVDDASPELLAHAAERIVAAGAVDIFIAPGLMKKGRPGFQLTVLCRPGERESVIAAIFRESPAIGLRQRFSERVVLERETRTIRVANRELRLKVSSWLGRQVNCKPEFDDVRGLAADLGIPVKDAMQMAMGAIHEKHGPGKN
jgi:hypothetical protein